MMIRLSPIAVAWLWALISIAGAQKAANHGSLTRVSATGTKDFVFIQQSGPKADDIRKTLRRIKLPTGFSVRLYAVVPDARHMAVGQQGIVTFVGTTGIKVWTVI